MEAVGFATSINPCQAVTITANFGFMFLKLLCSPGNGDQAPPTGVHHALARSGLWDLPFCVENRLCVSGHLI